MCCPSGEDENSRRFSFLFSKSFIVVSSQDSSIFFEVLGVSGAGYIIHLISTTHLDYATEHIRFGIIYTVMFLSKDSQSCPQLATENQERKRDREESCLKVSNET